jgi:hypothetical protein
VKDADEVPPADTVAEREEVGKEYPSGMSEIVTE